eukprot:Plantae.Rhodophyta-Purpureofilum_apyrenoidigerum.ctg4305.p1 GENE.Plantae.Rhodophyta-Purpureofilum_apyrenoidigerum.ctg4305~~Plantae.Rhodophyta-Purpureofilum_apyrenoidigerum.ctg4305.p1  ORF type:complete len:382 (+),score=41.86 Plantae.Rhodophyta-Purpureofilum_apyrenoidigerum.ctg4305:73-1218(+)
MEGGQIMGFVGAVTIRSRRGVRMDATDTNTKAARDASRQKRTAQNRDLAKVPVPAFERTLRDNGMDGLKRHTTTTLQINIGLTCNQACSHCHVESSPSRTETMPKIVADRLIDLVKTSHIKTIDITGGAPEMHDQFKYMVKSFRGMGLEVIDRCNLTILEEMQGTAEFLAENGVKVVASLPCYTHDNVEAQRGDGVFDASIAALQRLNRLGYGIPGSGLELNLVYNPGGAFLPPPQDKLKQDYKRELRRAFGIEFNDLIAITNMPIKRFADDLRYSNKLTEYLELLVRNFNLSTVDKVMCKNQVHVSWSGALYDCDFNYALDMPIPLSSQKRKNTEAPSSRKLSVFDIDSFDEMIDAEILTAKHCYGCTAGSGSSCGGSLE